MPERCPIYTDAAIEFFGFPVEQRACCVGADDSDARDPNAPSEPYCGIQLPDSYDTELGRNCEPFVTGERDDACLDTLVDGVRIEGCRRPDGKCGHLTDGWGCHTLYRAYWDWQLVDETTTLPNPFNCTRAEEPCSSTTECCFHPNYGGVCWADADELADGGPLVGYCTNPEETGHEPTPLPRF